MIVYVSSRCERTYPFKIAVEEEGAEATGMDMVSQCQQIPVRGGRGGGKKFKRGKETMQGKQIKNKNRDENKKKRK